MIDIATNSVVSTVPKVGAGPQDITYAPDGRHFYTANVEEGTVSVVDAETGVVTARLPSSDVVGANDAAACASLLVVGWLCPVENHRCVPIRGRPRPLGSVC